MTQNSSIDPDGESASERSWLENPKYMLVLAVLALAVGIWLARNTTRSAAARAELPPPADCRRFPGACTEGLVATPPPELAALHSQVAQADTVWRGVLEQNRRTGVFPDKALTAMRESLIATESAILDAYALLAEARGRRPANAGDPAAPDSTRMDTVGDDTTRAVGARAGDDIAFARDVLREAYEQKLALLTRAIRLFEGAV